MPPWQADWDVDRRFDQDATDALMANYLKAIEMRRKAHEMGALFGGKLPHPPAYIAGGFTANPRPERIAESRAYIDELLDFIEQRYIPDVEVLAAIYDDYFGIGSGYANLLAFGAFELDDTGQSKLFTDGFALAGLQEPAPTDLAAITEHVTFSWFQDKTDGLNPAVGQTTMADPNSKDYAYSWLKAPRYLDAPFEAGPLARMWVNGDYRDGISVMDRHLARAYETLKVAKAMRTWLSAEYSDQDWDEQTFVERLDSRWAKLNTQQRQAILSAAAVAAYHAQVEMPIVRLLICDDAPQFKWITEELALCWVHEGRHYKKLMPRFFHHLELLSDFREQFWDLYHQLLAYQQHPTTEERARLDTAFDELFSTCIRCYACRDACPLCYCHVCFVDESMPQWVGKSQDRTDTLTYQRKGAYLTLKSATKGESTRLKKQ